MDDFAVLSGDFLFERKRLSDSLKRLEAMIVSPDVSTNIGRVKLIELQTEIDRLTSGIFRLETLAKSLSTKAQMDRYDACDSFLNQISVMAHDAAKKSGRVLLVNAGGQGVKVDRHRMTLLVDILSEMLDTFIEYSIESPKERRLRGKKETAFLRVGIKREDDGVQLNVVADGNGVMPPLSDDHGRKLAAIGVRATFQGKPGKWSCWVFHVPHYTPVMSCFSVTFGGTQMYLPSGAVTRLLENDIIPSRNEDPIITVASDLTTKSLSSYAVPKGPVHAIQLAAGSKKVLILLETPCEREEVFVKPIPESLSGYGRFLGVVVDSGSTEQRLLAIVNPSYIVYGGHV